MTQGNRSGWCIKAHKGMDVGDWTVTIVLATVLVAVLAGLYPTFIAQIAAFRDATGNNTLAVVLYSIAPILIAAGILLLFVFEFLPSYHKRRGH